MLGLFFIILLAVYLIFVLPRFNFQSRPPVSKTEQNPRAKKLWTIAQESMKKQHPVRAEKALLAILKFDEKNAAAYNRLGILYTKEQKFDEATRCFEIAQSLDKNPALFHNTGLIYLETGQYEKAVMAFRQAIQLEGDLPARFIALAKAEEKLGHYTEALEALEAAFELEKNISTLRQILAIYEITQDQIGIETTTARIEAQITENAKLRAKKLSVSNRFSSFKRHLSKCPTPPTRTKPLSRPTTISNRNILSFPSKRPISRTTLYGTSTSSTKSSRKSRPNKPRLIQ